MEHGISKQADKGVIISIVAYLILSISKIVISYFTNSEALRADGLNNTTDIIASIAVLIGLKISRKPRDSNHPYGHSRVEQISSLVASFIMVTVGIQVFIGGARAIFKKEHIVPDPLAAWTAFASAIIMYGVYLYNRKLAKKVQSTAVDAAAKDNLSDALVSVGTVVGIVGAQFGFPLLDPIAAIVVAIVICKTAWDIFFESTHLLTDGFDPELLSEYVETVEKMSNVYKVCDLKARYHGNRISVDLTVEVDETLDIIESHKIADDIEKLLKEKHKASWIYVHIEPRKIEELH